MIDPSRTLYIWHDFGNVVKDKFQERLLTKRFTSTADLQIQLDLLDDDLDDLFTFYMWWMLNQGITFSTEYMNRVDPQFHFASEWTPADLTLKDQLMQGVREYLDKWETDIKENVADVISENAGESVDVIGSKVADAIGSDQNRGVMIARTELMRAFNKGAESRYKKAGFRMKWLTAEDLTVCEDCEPLDGVDVTDSGERPPKHTFCRCCLVPAKEESNA